MSLKQINIEDSKVIHRKNRKNRKKSSKFKIFLIWLEYDVWNSITYYLWRNPKRIVYNFWYFRKVIYNYRDFDYNYNFDLFIYSLERTANAIDKRELIVEHKKTADSIRNFCKLYKKYIEDEYMEEAGCNWDNVSLDFEPIEGKDLFELKQNTSYSDEEMEKFRKKAKKLQDKDFKEMIEEFKNFETWWD